MTRRLPWPCRQACRWCPRASSGGVTLQNATNSEQGHGRLRRRRAADRHRGVGADQFDALGSEENIETVEGFANGDVDVITGFRNNEPLRLEARGIDTSRLRISANAHVIASYNRTLDKVSELNPDLDDYATDRAIEGLFLMIAREEKNLRENPVARTTEILKRVFGAQQ